MMSSNAIKAVEVPLEINEGNDNIKIRAKNQGYSFKLLNKKWVLDRNIVIDLDYFHLRLNNKTLMGFLKTLAFYARNMSPSYTYNISVRFKHMLKSTDSHDLTNIDFINYKSSLSKDNAWYLGFIRGFLRKWYELGYEGIDESVISLLDSWRIKGNRKGDAVKRLDPIEGPLTDNELQAFNEGSINAYERGVISLDELAMSLIISHTGRRPIQISHLKVADVLCGKNKRGEPYFILNTPRAKHGEGFRTQFKHFAITEELWLILSAQTKNAIEIVESQLKFKLNETDRQLIPLFPDYSRIKRVDSLFEFRALSGTDKLHMASAKVTDTLHFIVEASEVKSERTGQILSINARRFRYTTGTRAARQGFGELVIAELLDHSDTQNAGVYIKNIPEHVEKLDAAVGFQLAPYAQAFAGVLVDSEKEAERGNDPSSRIRTQEGSGIGTCGEHGFCGANVPIPCYTCMHFQPWLDGPHQEVYENLLSERERVKSITGDIEVAAILDRSILAVADVISRCEKRRSELQLERGVGYE